MYCWNALIDWKTFSSAAGPSLELSGRGEDYSLIGTDPPRHTKLRNIISRSFTPRRIADLEPRIRAITADLFLQEFVPEGAKWVHLDIAGPFILEKKWKYFPEGATGFGVKTFVELAESF